MRDHEKDCVESMENFLNAIKMFSRMEEPIDKNSYLRIGEYIEEVHKLSSGKRSCHVKFLAIKMSEEYDKLKVKGE